MTHQDAARGVEDGVSGELASPLLAGDALEAFLPPAQAPAYDAYEGAAASLDFYDLENNHLMSTYLEAREAIEESHGAAGAARRRLRGAERRLAFRRRLDDLFASDATEHGVADANLSDLRASNRPGPRRQYTPALVARSPFRLQSFYPLRRAPNHPSPLIAISASNFLSPR